MSKSFIFYKYGLAVKLPHSPPLTPQSVYRHKPASLPVLIHHLTININIILPTCILLRNFSTELRRHTLSLNLYHIRREEKPTICHWMVYCTYNMVNMFRKLLCPSSGAWDYMCVITAYGVRCFGCWLLEVRSMAAGYAFEMKDVARLSRATSLIPTA